MVRFFAVLVFAGCAGCAASTAPRGVPAGPPTHLDVQPRIVTADDVTTEAELGRRGERSLMEQRWEDAAAAYRTLASLDPPSARLPEYLFDLGLAYEGVQERAKARDVFMDLAKRFPEGPKARASLVRAASLDAYLEDWQALATIGDRLLSRGDLEDVDRVVALGSRGLARIELGDDAGASKDVLEGLDLSDRLHYGERDVLPVAVAQLRFALGEIRRVRSERVSLDRNQPDFYERFLQRLEERSVGVLEAQQAYAMAVRSIDPHWAAMSGYRVGEMYRTLHRDLMQIPPPPESKTERQKQVFYAFMHVRYRIMLEKGLRQLEQTIALGERTGDTSAWIARAHEAKREMETALADEKAQIGKMPFTEDEIEAALARLEGKRRH